MLQLKKVTDLSVIAVAILLLFTTALAYFFTASNSVVSSKPAIDLAKNIPTEFGDWKLDPDTIPITTPADLQRKIEELYSEVVSRTYVNSKGVHVMLSIAYGRNQGGESTQVHRPEICYRAQGFSISNEFSDIIKSQFRDIPVERLMTTHGQRLEPVTYWILLGDHLVKSGLDRKIWQIKYGLKREMPDGLLFRVSTIDANEQNAYKDQDQFVNDLLNHLNPVFLPVMIGSSKPNE